MMLKRFFDIIMSLVGLILLSPVFLVIAILIKIFMSGPVLFRQQRTGRYDKTFFICKFKTMIVNHQETSITVKGEGRITPLGAVLRKYKLDELPELWNILLGEMSFVGPRPDLPEYSKRLIGEEKLILNLRPGLTGPATLIYVNEEELLADIRNPIKYNDEILWPNKVRINLDYYYNRSFLGDIRIILKTIFTNGN